MNLDKTPEWYRSLPIELIHEKSDQHGLDPFLVSAICRQESNCNPWAIRFEPKNINLIFVDEFAKKNAITKETEKILQSSSIGILQIMGYNARSLGLKDMLTTLFDPVIGLEYGCQMIEDLFRRFKDQDSVISAYNQGTPRKNHSGEFVNQKYVSSVKAYFKELTQSF